MALLRSTQFAQAKVVVTVSPGVVYYTVPAGHRITLKSVALRNLGGSGQTFRLLLDGAVHIYTKVLAAGSTSGGTSDDQMWIVLNPGQTISAYVSDSTGVNMVLSGYLLFI